MVLERVEINAKPGQVAALVATLRETSVPLLLGIPGCLAARCGGGIENPDKIILLVDWTSLAAHEAFKTMPEYKTLVAGFITMADGAAAEHFTMG